MIESVKQWKSEVGDCDWICRYYDDIWGVWKPERVSQRLRRICVLSVVNAITRIKEPVWERVFSAKVFNDSKKFEKMLSTKDGINSD